MIGQKGVHAVEAYVLGLFQLYPTIYLHKATRGAEKLFTEMMVQVFKLARDGSYEELGLHRKHPLVEFALEPGSTDRALCLDDTVVYGCLSLLCDSKDPLISEFALRLRDRKLYKCFDVREYIKKKLSSGIHITEAEKAVSRLALSSMEKIDLWSKTANKSRLLKDETSRSPYKRLHESKGPLNQIMVHRENGSLIDIAEYSPVVAAIPKFEVLRYYFDKDKDKQIKQLIDIVDGEIKHGI